MLLLHVRGGHDVCIVLACELGLEFYPGHALEIIVKLFGQMVRTVVNIALLPVALAADVATAGGVMAGKNDQGRLADTYTGKLIDKLKDEASE